MNIHHLTLGIGMVLLLAGAGNSAEVKTKDLSCTFAATFVSGVENHLDTNGDMRSASVHQGLVNCNIGQFLFQEEFEFLDPLPAPVTCPTGTTEFDLLQAHGVLTAEKTADQLFFEDAAGGGRSVCTRTSRSALQSMGPLLGARGSSRRRAGPSTVKARGNT